MKIYIAGETLIKVKEWFTNYAASFSCDDPDIGRYEKTI